MLISFSGVDGSGKSTQIEMFSKYFKKTNKKVLVLKIFEYFLLKPVIALLKKNKTSKLGIISKTQNPIFVLWCIPALLDIWISYLINILPALFKYDIIICDRYYYDMAVNMAYYGYMPKSFLKYYIGLLPRSDIGITFLLDPLPAHKRSKEFDLSYYIDQHKLYSNLKWLTKVIIVDKKSHIMVGSEVRRILED